MLKSRTTKSHTPKRSVSTRSCRLANWIILGKKEARKEARVFEIGMGLDGSTVRELRWMIKSIDWMVREREEETHHEGHQKVGRENVRMKTDWFCMGSLTGGGAKVSLTNPPIVY